MVIKLEVFDSELKELLEQRGYAVIIFDDLTNPEERARLQQLFVHAQSYMDQARIPKDLPQGKTAVVINKSVWKQLQEDQQTFDAWKANRAYTTVIDDF